MLEIIKYLRILASKEVAKPLETLDEELLAGMDSTMSEEVHSDFLWILIVNLLIFIGLTVVSYQASLKIAEATQTTEDPNSLNKLKFIKGLTYANGSNLISCFKLEKNNSIYPLKFLFDKHNKFSQSIVLGFDHHPRE